MIVLHCRIAGLTPYSQSRKLIEQRAKDEGPDEFERRIWRQKAHVAADGDTVLIPAHGIQQMLSEGARRGRLRPSAAQSKREGLAKRLEAGIALLADATTDMTISGAQSVAINAHVTGKITDGSRVTRIFPLWTPPWSAAFDIMLLDESLTEADLEAALKHGGLLVGLGRHRPEKRGINGRFTVTELSVSELGMDQLRAA